MEPFEKHPFPFSQNIAEFIPYEDKSFTFITSVTSLDHVLLLDKALQEIKRVLSDEGIFLLWIGETKVNKVYNPYSPVCKAIDEYHMFHIHPEWFEKVMEEQFVLLEHYFDCVGHHFYAYSKKL